MADKFLFWTRNFKSGQNRKQNTFLESARHNEENVYTVIVFYKKK